MWPTKLKISDNRENVIISWCHFVWFTSYYQENISKLDFIPAIWLDLNNEGVLVRFLPVVSQQICNSNVNLLVDNLTYLGFILGISVVNFAGEIEYLRVKVEKSPFWLLHISFQQKNFSFLSDLSYYTCKSWQISQSAKHSKLPRTCLTMFLFLFVICFISEICLKINNGNAKQSHSEKQTQGIVFRNKKVFKSKLPRSSSAFLPIPSLCFHSPPLPWSLSQQK